MTRLLTLLIAIGLTGCIDQMLVSALSPANLRMPEFGAPFDADTHGLVAPDAAKLIIYRDPEIDERIKYFVRILRRRQKDGFLCASACYVGVVFAGAFLEATRVPDTLEVRATHRWWNENPPAGKTLWRRMKLGEPPTAQDGRTTHDRSIGKLDMEALTGTITYLRLKRTVTEEIKTCAESAETIDLCTYFTYATLLEIVPPDEAQRELAGLKETVYAKAK